MLIFFYCGIFFLDFLVFTCLTALNKFQNRPNPFANLIQGLKKTIGTKRPPLTRGTLRMRWKWTKQSSSALCEKGAFIFQIGLPAKASL